MIVADLIQELQKLPQSLEVYASADEEGNGFNSIFEVKLERMDENNDVYHPEDYEDHKDNLRETVVVWG